MMDRRHFLKKGGLLALSFPALGSLIRTGTSDKLSAFGIQLYMVRDAMEKDTAGTLSRLGKMGYTQIESFGGNKGMFWGMDHREFKKIADGYGLTLISSHYNDGDIPFEETAAMAAEIGMKYLICPWKGPQKSIDDFKHIAAEFNSHGEICKKHGLRFAYHPHDYPYKRIDGQLPIDVLLANTDKDLVDFEMDFYYTVTEGQSPEAYLNNHRNRFALCHMRDVLKVHLPAGDKEESACDLGQGIMDYPHLIDVAQKDGMKYFFVEQSRFFHETDMQSAAVNADYLKKLTIK